MLRVESTQMKSVVRCALALMMLSGSVGARAASVALCVDAKTATAEFARQEVEAALKARGDAAALAELEQMGKKAGARIVLALRSEAKAVEAAKRAGAAEPKASEAEGFSIRVSKSGGAKTMWVFGADAGGMLYGALELAETIRLEGLDKVHDADQKPYLAMRGVKFNIPLDARTPSYTDVSDSAQQNIATVWDFAFWQEFIDRLARDRYNFVSLWSLHPFPSMVKVQEYPDVALADVKRSRAKWKENYALEGMGFDDPEITRDMETLKAMTIEEKIAFWRKVMAYAKSRNVDFYVMTWNIFVNGTEGKYGITDKIDNPVTADYFRKSVKAMLLTYPDLAGIGLTTGENMPKATSAQKEEWAFKTYGMGVMDAAKEAPGRKIRFIHRQHQTGAQEITKRFEPMIKNPDIEFNFSFKYAQAHVYSSMEQPFCKDFVGDLNGVKTLWTLRNDDFYHVRWGAPDFVREFMQKIPVAVSQGYYYGSDQWIWGREFLSAEPESPRELEIAKHWYEWMLWGRLGYDPTVSDARFEKIIAARFPGADAKRLFTAWQEASMAFPLVTGFHWGAMDFQWYAEACKSRPEPAQTASGFHDVNRFITLKPHPGTDNVSIPDYVKAVMAGKKAKGTTPVRVSHELGQHAEKALKIAAGMREGDSKELSQTLNDIRAMGWLGKYYSAKILGATELALYRASGDEAHKKAAVAALTEGAAAWEQYVGLLRAQYRNPLWTNRVGIVDWEKLSAEVKRDIAIAEEAKRKGD